MSNYAKKLNGIITNYKKICIAFSGGIDSSLLLYLASQQRPVVAVIIDAPMVKREDIAAAEEFAQSLENVTLIKQPFDIFSIPEFTKNSPERCYFCKKALFEQIKDVAQAYQCDVIFDGTNSDDLNDYRPGLKAIKELGIISPFVLAGLTKSDIYYLSNLYGLPTKNKPASACLASRIKTNFPITKEELAIVEEGERLLSKYGFKQLRLRLINDHCGYIEILRENFALYYENQEEILNDLKRLELTVDKEPHPYQQGSMNEVENEG